MPLLPKQELENLTTLLTLFHHRNKNQHRLAKWYKHLTTLHRQVRKLLSEVNIYQSAVELSTKSKYAVAARERVKERVVFVGEWVVGVAYLAFSTVVADNRYAALGLMLMGVLARFKSVLSVLGEEVGVPVEDPSLVDEEEVSVLKEGGDDFGEVVSRDVLVDVGEDEDQVRRTALRTPEKGNKKRGEDEEKRETDVVESTPSKRPKKKRKKGGDALDDLFSGLL